jgi:AcrR family transcriptional regulator
MAERVPKAERTKAKILDYAVAQSSVEGLSGLTLGRLASDLGVSKSGLFAHFGSKERLELAVLQHAALDFRREVIERALEQPRGMARLVALFELWMRRLSRLPGGCPVLGAAFEFDDIEGPVRDELVLLEGQLRSALARAVRLSIESGEVLAHTDPAQFAFEMHALILAYHFELRLMRATDARSKVERVYSALIARVSGVPDSGYSELFQRYRIDLGGAA